MALLFLDSFDHYVLADVNEKWSSNEVGGGPAWTIQPTDGRRSGPCARLGSAGAVQPFSSGAFLRSLTVSGNTGVCGVAFRIGRAPESGGRGVLAFRQGSTCQCQLRLNSNLTLSVVRGPLSGGTVLGSPSAFALTLDTFCFIEFKLVIDNAAGAAEVRVNGASVLSLTSQDTQNTASATWDQFSMGCANADFGGSSWNDTTGPQYMYYDDLYVLDGSGAAPWNGFLGDCRVDVRNPTGAGAVTQWTPSAGSNYQNVDDAAPDDDTTYNTAAAAALTDTFVCQDAPVVGAAIYGVQVNLSAKKTDAGTCSIASVVRQSSSNQVATAQNPGTSYAYLRTVYQTNPHTAAQWTEADFNADEFGYSRTA